MTAKSSGKIPIPLSRRWREFRIRYAPLLVFAVLTLVVGHLWNDHVRPVRMTGLAMGDEFIVRSPRDGWVSEFFLRPYDPVAEGQRLLRVQPADMEDLRARLGVLRAEIDLIQVGLDPLAGLQRNRLNYEQLRLDLINARIQLAEDRLEEGFLSREHSRNEALQQQGVISESTYDQIFTRWNLLRTRVAEGEQSVEELAKRLAVFEQTWDALPSDLSPVDAAVRVKEQEISVLETALAPLQLLSPMTGVVSILHQPAGSFVEKGDALVTLRARKVTAVVGYLRQPVHHVPEPGHPVEVMVRGRKIVLEGVVTRIGTQFEPLPGQLLFPGQTLETGLPVLIELPEGGDVFPGEVLQIRL